MTMYQYVVINGCNYTHPLDMPAGVFKGKMPYLGNGVGDAYFIDTRAFTGKVVNVGGSDVMARAYGELVPIVRQDGSRNDSHNYSPRYNAVVGVGNSFDNRRSDQWNKYFDDDIQTQWADDGTSTTQEAVQGTNVYKDLLSRIVGNGKVKGVGSAILVILAYLLGNGTVSMSDVLRLLGI